jgi:hypothetical protein
MKKHYFGLLVSLVISGVLVAGSGIFIKANLPEDYAYYQQHNAVALPFALAADGNLLTVLNDELSMLTAEPEPTQACTTGATEPEAEQTTAAATEQTMEPPDAATDTTLSPVETETTEVTVPPSELPVPVDNTYFDDTLFIGDSRMCGLRDFARMGGGDYFCDVGMTVFNLWERSATDYGYGTMELKDLLGLIPYGKIYVALGINEAGFPIKNFVSEYEALIRKLQQMQPDAIIILQSVMAVTEEYAGGRSYFAPSYLAQMNEFIASLADDETVFYLDVNEAVTDENGYLLKELTLDGCHLLAKQVPVWADWLKRSVPKE